MSKTKKHEDLAGRPIAVGDYVAYAALWSRSATLKYGRVVELVVKKKDIWGTGWDPCTKVQVVSVDRTFNDAWELQGAPWQEKTDGKYDYAKAKVQTLEFLDRMLVVSKEQIPVDARKLLDAAYKVKTDV